jgi:hypothetical protein
MPEHGWIYRHGDFELAQLAGLVERGFAANRYVDYAMNFSRLDDAPVTFRRGGASPFEVTVPPIPGQPAGFYVGSDTDDWSVDGIPCLVRAGAADDPPHRRQEPIVRITAAVTDGIVTLEAPVLGRPIISSATRPAVQSGESLAEALGTVAETRHDILQLDDTTWTTVHELGFRYLRISGAAPATIDIDTRVRSSPVGGSFLSSSSRLNDIWTTSARTLRLCMQGLMLDGIKRDRMPWIGDQALNTFANAYAVGDGGIVRDSITALGRPTHGYVNGIADYSLWWLINARSYQRYFDDRAFLAREASNIAVFLTQLASYATDAALFRPRTEPDGFEGAGEGSVFIDWGASFEPGRDSTALQVLWCWALASGAELLALADHPAAARWDDLAATARASVTALGWDSGRGLWKEYLGDCDTTSPYPNFLAVLAGLGEATAASVGVVTGADRLGTPFMTSFAIQAIGRTGRVPEAVARIESLWGGMLDAGAATFWEEFAEASSPADVSNYAMYGREFGKSLCHAWGSGPAALLPELVLGIRPLADGWGSFEVVPALGDLDWAAATVPTPHGDIVVRAEGSSVTVTVPAGTTLVRGDARISGPTTVTV